MAMSPHPNIGHSHTPNAKPAYESIDSAVVQLNANTVVVHLNGGDKKLGHLILAVEDAE